MSILTSTRTYPITNDDKFTVSSIALLSSIRILPEEMFGIKMQAPEQTMYINGIKIPQEFYNKDKQINFFDFAYMRQELKKIDPYEEERDFGETTPNQLYSLEQVLLQGEIDAGDVYKLSDEDFSGSVFTPYAIIRFENENNEFIESLKIEETYFIRK